MQSLADRRSCRRGSGFRADISLALACAAFALPLGCASPGNPLPPTLKLPAEVTDLTASRVGDDVQLHWTNPAKTTDGLAIKGRVTAEICRAGLTATGAANTAPATPACAVVATEAVSPGASQAVDRLPAGMAVGRPGLLIYRVQLKNAAGRTAGPSGPAYAASGEGPAGVVGLRAKATKAGAVVEWTRSSADTDRVELERSGVADPKTPGAAIPRDAATQRLRAGDMDSGGTVDRSARTGETYRYTAQRVREVQVAGHSLEMRTPLSAEASVAMVDVFPPESPTGLVASPGFTGQDQPRTGTIDLSWEPGIEAGVAGYRVYRKIGNGEWLRLGTGLVAVPAFRDTAVEQGQRYAYRVTTVDTAGNESGPSNVVEQTAPER